MSRNSRPNALEALVSVLGHPFKDSSLILDALTHRSYVNEIGDAEVRDNERLEFLGDAVIDLIVSAELMRRHPEAREGALSRMRASIVSEAALSHFAESIHLGDALRLGRGEELSGGRSKPSLLADAFEAVIAAVYLDAGLEGAGGVFLAHFPFPDDGEAARGDPKTELQQRIQATSHVTPLYRVVEETGPDHSKFFVVEILVGGDVLGRGEGRSKKEAEQRAAAIVLENLDREAPASPSSGAGGSSVASDDVA